MGVGFREALGLFCIWTLALEENTAPPRDASKDLVVQDQGGLQVMY